MREDVASWCRKCVPCQLRKRPQKSLRSPMQQYIVGAPLERIAIDILGPLPETHDGNRYVLVVGDYFSKWIDAFAMPNMETTTIVDLLVSRVICQWGMPLHIHTDRGSQFESDIFQQLCTSLDITKTHTTAYHPQSDGMIERFNRTLEEMLSKFVAEDQRNWDHCLPLMMLAYRSSTHDSTGFSPALLFLGREVRLPLDLLVGCPPPEAQTDRNYHEYVDRLQNDLHRIHEIARQKLLSASDRQKRNYDHRKHIIDFPPGSPVLLHSNRRRKGLSPKLQKRWDGPYLVIRLVSDYVYEIQKTPRSKKMTVHHDRLKPFHGQFQNWLRKDDSDEVNPTHDSNHDSLSDFSNSSWETDGSDDEISQPQPVTTRAGRQVKRPSRLRDYVMS